MWGWRPRAQSAFECVEVSVGSLKLLKLDGLQLLSETPQSLALRGSPAALHEALQQLQYASCTDCGDTTDTLRLRCTNGAQQSEGLLRLEFEAAAPYLRAAAVYHEVHGDVPLVIRHLAGVARGLAARRCNAGRGRGSGAAAERQRNQRHRGHRTRLECTSSGDTRGREAPEGTAAAQRHHIQGILALEVDIWSVKGLHVAPKTHHPYLVSRV